MTVYATFGKNWAEAYEFGESAYRRIASGDLDPLYDAGVSNFNRVMVEDDEGGYREVWSKYTTNRK
jgi:hypothetical protein